ncbi:MAG: ammonia-forming cytochrome c nitrite reductase subunit c552, partial [Thermoanaerobaculia bacterium]
MLAVVLILTLAAPPRAGRAAQEFVGSARCATCHKRQHQLWAEDWHSRALSPASSRAVVARFDPPIVFNERGTRAEAFRSGAAFRMKAEGPDGSFGNFPVDWVIGGRRMQDFVTTFPDGRLQVLPIYFHVTGKGEWVDYTTLKQGALTREHPFFWANYARTFNKECLSCHVTGEEMGWNEKAGEFSTTWSEPGIACERCHGAGARHAKDGLARSIVRPTALSKERGLALCASCHAPRAPWRSAFSPASRFRAGQRFDEVFEPVTPVLGPGDLSGDFWLDGRPSVGSMESAAFEQSMCVRKGGMTCFDCHTAPHGRGGLSELRPISARDGACLKCHLALAEASAAAKHSFHKQGPGSACADCHMPRTVVGVLDAQIDHSIDVPNPANARDFGIPDACTACHAGKSPEWAIAELERRFPGSRRGARRQRLAHALGAWRDHLPSA